MAERILLVEDDEMLRTWVDYELSEDGYQVSLANNGLTGLQVVRETQPDLILLDVMMPGMNGFDVARELQNDPQTAGLPIIFLTARGSTEDKLTGYNAGGVNYLTKPFKMNELKANIKALLNHTNTIRRQETAEVEEAAQIQRNLIPGTIPAIEGLEIYAGYKSARLVSGDFYDFLVRPDGQLVFALADVSGKGLPAAMMMSSVRTAVRSAARKMASPQAVLRQVNQDLYDDLTKTRKFITLFLGFYKPQTRQITYANAGHSPVIFYSAPSPARILEADGPPLGVLPVTLSENHVLDFVPNDLLVVGSDGLNEAENLLGEMFGYRRLLEVVHNLAGAEVSRLGTELFSRVIDFAAGRRQIDDQTLLVLKGAVNGQRQ